MTILVYHYDNQNLFVRSSEARMNPITPDVPIVPANATLITPMELIDPYTIQQFVPTTENTEATWVIIPDYRGYHYFTPADDEVVIADVNITPSIDAVEMSDDDRVTQNEDGTWRLITPDDDLNAAKELKISELKASFSLELNNDGLNSSALGTEHKYDTEQHNIVWLLACVALTTASPETTYYITCDDLLGGADSKQPRYHTQAECGQLLSNSITTIQAMKDKLAGLKAEVNAAVDEAEIDAINWDPNEPTTSDV